MTWRWWFRPLAIACMGTSGMVSSAVGQGWWRSYESALESFKAGDRDDAVDALTTAIRDMASSAPSVQWRAPLEMLLTLGEYEEVEQAATRLVAAASGWPGLWNTLGEAQAYRGKLSDAEQSFRRAIREGAGDSVVAELNLGRVQLARGQRDSAFARFDRFIDFYNGSRGLAAEQLLAVASALRHLGARSYGHIEDALRVYDEAIAADPALLDAHVGAGELLLEKYNGPEAREAFEAALAVNPSYPSALLGLARVHHFDGSSEALPTAVRSLEINPNSVGAHTFLARLQVELENYPRATTEIEKALDVDPGSLEAWSVRAAIRFITGDRRGFIEARDRVLSRNPSYAGFYNTLADVSARNRLYSAAVDFARQAVALDSSSWEALALLGMNELRDGAIDQGIGHLQRAFEADPYNPWVKNTLDLTDTFQQYRTVGTERFKFILHENEADLLQLYIGPVAEEAYDAFAAKYDFQAATPIRVEVYPRHADFSVRTVGLAGLGALGVSFGPVIAMDSPSARDIGEFNWGSTLWHELAHTFHLGLTEHRVPRWFTEGLAVYEERQARRGWGDDVTVSFLEAFRQDRLLPVSQLNSGFVRPSYPEQVIHSYYEASLVCDYIVQERGSQALRLMLQAYRTGKGHGEVIRDVTGMEPEAFDRAFASYLRERFTAALVALDDRDAPTQPMSVGALERAARGKPNSFPAQLRAGRALFEAARFDDALPFLEKARELFPAYAGPDSPHWFIANIYKEKGRTTEAIAALDQLTTINGNHYRALVLLAELHEGVNDRAKAAEALERAMYIYPFDVTVHERLAGLYEGRADWTRAVRERRAVMALDPVDVTEAGYQLAHALFQAGRLAEARSQILRTLERAPSFEKALDLLLEIRARTRTPDREAA